MFRSEKGTSQEDGTNYKGFSPPRRTTVSRVIFGLVTKVVGKTSQNNRWGPGWSINPRNQSRSRGRNENQKSRKCLYTRNFEKTKTKRYQ